MTSLDTARPHIGECAVPAGSIPTMPLIALDSAAVSAPVVRLILPGVLLIALDDGGVAEWLKAAVC
jgi:hypothetical protein